MKGIAIMERRVHTLTIGQKVGLVDHNPQFHVDLPLPVQDGLFRAGAVCPDQCIGEIAQGISGEIKIQGFSLIEDLVKSS
ncbi:MAG: hypothetical protein MUO52_13100 [Desulfobacterales bacterium]|nr:hypothetical protein [Desulfobacterales bacterium]